MKNIVLIGAGGHCKVVIDIIQQNENYNLVGLIDKDHQNIGNKVLQVPIIGTDSDLEEILKQGQASSALIAIGSTGDNKLRKKLYDKIKELGYDFINVIHPNTTLAKSLKLGTANTIMAGAIINPEVVIGDNNIINTGSIIEHDTVIKNNVHVGPGVKISGGATIGNNTHLGTGATIIQHIKIGENCLIGAGAVVINDIPNNSVVVGNPGQVIKKRGEIDE
ncbi:MAG: acetyltransferase [Bacillota bacterium]